MNKKLFVISVLVLACSACGTVPVEFIDQNSAVDGSAAADGASAADAGSPADAGKASADECPDGWNKAQSDSVALCWKKFAVGLACPKGYFNVNEGLDFDKNLVCTKKVEASTDAGSADAGSPADATKVVTLDDKDEDGFLPKVDCNDNDPAVHPGAPEKCNGKDDDCDGVVDEGCPAPQQPVDNDGDGATTLKDCNDSDASVYPGATEKCNGKDDDCDGVVDEGCPAPQQPVDKDGDGHYSAPDCNDNDPSVFPGATELCNGKDDDCDGVTDEGCPALQPTSGEVVVTVKYTSSKTRVLNVQLFDDASQLGKWWGKSTSSDGTTVSASLTGVNLQKACGIRLNVSVGNPAYAWLCEGNGSTANLDPGAEIDIKWGTTTLHKSDLATWSSPGGTNQGCSAVLLRNGCSL